MARTPTTRLGQSVWTSGTDPVRRVDFNADAQALENLVAIYDQGLLSARPVAGIEGRFYTVVGESDAKLNGRIYYDNGSVWTSPRFLSDGYAESSAGNATALIVKSASSPSVDIFRVNSSSDAGLLRVTSNGVVSNQSSVGISGGFYLGGDSTHDAAASFISVGTTKPTLIVKAIASQSSSLISARDVNNASVFSVSTTGNGIFSGSLSANSILSNTTISGHTLSSTNSSAFVNSTISPLNNSSPSLVVKSFSNHQNNLIDFLDATDARVARVTPEGSFATNSRVIVGNNNGNSTTPSYTSTTAALWVSNSYPNAPVARFIGNSAQSGKLLELAGGDAVNKFTVDNQGNTVITGNLSSASISVNGSSPTPYFTGYQPLVEIITGGEAGTYNQAVTLRHATQNTTAVSRSLGLHFKLSSEANSAESLKWAGVSAVTTEANAANPNLVFYSAGVESGRFDALSNLKIGGDLLLTNKSIRSQGGLRPHWYLSADETHTIGLQTNSLYMRAPSFAWYAGGTHDDAQFNPGATGLEMMRLHNNGVDARLTTQKLTLTNVTPYDSLAPILSIGALDNPSGHMQFSNGSINNYTIEQEGGTLNLQNGGGTLNLGSGTTAVKIPSRIFWVGSNRVVFGDNTFPGTPIQNDWWFDHTTERILVRTGSNSWHEVARYGT